MTAAPHHADHTTGNRKPIHDPRLFTPLADRTIQLLGGAELHITSSVPATAAGRRAALAGSVLYFICGWLDTPGNYLSGYIGQTQALTGTRPSQSWTHWVRTTGRIIPLGLGLLRAPGPVDPDLLTYIEARAIQHASSWPRCISLLNTHTSAQIAAARLTREQVLHGQDLADQAAFHAWRELYRGQHNPWPAPAPNTREAAVRVVQRSPRALDIDEIIEQLRAAGRTTTGQTWAFSIRRDLCQREPTRGRPRIASTWDPRRHRVLLWNPKTLTKRQAIHGYDNAHPPRLPRTPPYLDQARPGAA